MTATEQPEDLSWEEAIRNVLSSKDAPMHYVDIAEEIVSRGLKSSVGPTPAASVNAIISGAIGRGELSPFVRMGRGLYGLKSAASAANHDATAAEDETEDDTGLINAFGMYWNREKILWKSKPRILGQQQIGSAPVDFCDELGVYLLHDGRTVIYVGRTTDQALGVRLKQHTMGRLNGRWDRFSWFGILAVDDKGGLDRSKPANLSVEMLIVTMEALLIEGLEPPQNRKSGDDFRAIEFLQVEDLEIQKSNIVKLMDELKKKL